MTRWLQRSAIRTTLTVVTLIALAGPAMAAGPAVLFAKPGYWSRFTDYWSSVFKQSNGITLIVIGVGIVSLFVITRGKWRK
jgi:hypothetical protein